VKVVGSSTATVFEELGAADNDNAAWTMENVSMTEFTGQIVYLLIEAADNVVESTVVEAAIDDMLLVINHHPDAEPRSVLTPEDTPVDVLLTGSDAEGDPLTFTITSDPSH
jgi:hypothetical protein